MSDRHANETENAVEKLLLTKNGAKKTVADVFELVLAVNHDSKARDSSIASLLESHCAEANVRDVEIDELQAWRAESTERCPERVLAIVQREHEARHEKHLAAEHGDDSGGEDWGRGVFEDTEMGDIRRFWRTGKWFVMVAAAPFIVALGDQISHRLFGG